jgi:hypothetical protein
MNALSRDDVIGEMKYENGVLGTVRTYNSAGIPGKS